MRTLFIAELLGNPELWKNVVAQEAQSADRIVQLGNLLSHYTVRPDEGSGGPNLQLMRLVNAYRYTQEDWLQIAGPNEMLALNAPGTFTSENTDRLLRESWFRTSANPNPWMAVAGVDKGRLVSHGGLTHGLWRELGSPTTAEEAAEALDERYRNTVYQGDGYSLGHAPNFSANPIWADPLLETYPSWITAEESCPFGQIHGAANLNTPRGQLLRGEDSSYFSWFDRVLHKSYGSIAEIKGTSFIGLFLGLPLKEVRWLPEAWSLYMEES